MLPAWKTSGSTRCFGVRPRERLRGREGEEKRAEEVAESRRGAGSRFRSTLRCAFSLLVCFTEIVLSCSARRSTTCATLSCRARPPRETLLSAVPCRRARSSTPLAASSSTRSRLTLCSRTRIGHVQPTRRTDPPSELSRALRAARQPFARSFVLPPLAPMLLVTLQPSRSNRAWLRRERDGLAAVQRSHGPLALQLQLELFLSSPGRTPQSCACALRRATAAASVGRVHVIDERQALEVRTSGRSERPPRSSRSRSSRQHGRSPVRRAHCDARTSAAQDATTARAEALSALVLSGRTRTKRGRRHCRTALDS